LIQKLETDGAQLYEVDLGVISDSSADPVELLMAAAPQGVVSYFSAVAFHRLTTQIVAHHHVAKLTAPAAKLSEPKASIKNATESPRSRSPLGKPFFTCNGTAYYVTSRSRRLSPGIQRQNYGIKTLLRITTLEQTLIDTLIKPLHCGGPEVVFEAWREACDDDRLQESQLAGHLRQMKYPAADRRVAAMLAILDRTPGPELATVLNATLDTLDRSGPYARISLLPGIDYQSLDEKWLVSIP
jgi:hypothetical protein